MSPSHSAFIAAMDEGEKYTRTENGADSLTAFGVGDARVALFFKLVRGAGMSTLEPLFEDAVQEAKAQPDDAAREAALVDVFLIALHTRCVRHGKGEKQCFNDLLRLLFAKMPRSTVLLLDLLPTYGSYADLVRIAQRAEDESALGPLRDRALRVLAAALRADSAKPEDSRELTLAAKWAPREGRATSRVAKALSELLFPGAPDARRRYRRLVAGLNRRLGTTEVEMCAGTWDVDPSAVPASCLKRQRAAFLNKPTKRQCAGLGPRAPDARSDDPARVACAERFAAHAARAREDPASAKLHGAALMPHEMVREYMDDNMGGYIVKAGAGAEDDVIEAQWVDLRERLLAEAEAAAGGGEAGAGRAAGLGKFVPLVDVSGSMSGEPMEVAVALGVLISEVTREEFRGRFITFETSPEWHVLPEKGSLRDKVRSATSAPWGGSTNFQAALELVLKRCVSADLPPAEVADLTLVVLSDMQFDQAAEVGFGARPRRFGERPGWESQHAALTRAFAEAGRRTSHGEPYPVPRVLFWNLRAGTRDFPADAHTPGVQMLAGFSAAMLKVFLRGEVRQSACSLELLRAALDQECYGPARTALRAAEVGRRETAEEARAAGRADPAVFAPVATKKQKGGGADAEESEAAEAAEETAAGEEAAAAERGPPGAAEDGDQRQVEMTDATGDEDWEMVGEE